MDVNPVTMKRVCGGWLAVSPDNEPIKIGVTGDTEQVAVEGYRIALSNWRDILASTSQTAANNHTKPMT